MANEPTTTVKQQIRFYVPYSPGSESSGSTAKHEYECFSGNPTEEFRSVVIYKTRFTTWYEHHNKVRIMSFLMSFSLWFFMVAIYWFGCAWKSFHLWMRVQFGMFCQNYILYLSVRVVLLFGFWHWNWYPLYFKLVRTAVLMQYISFFLHAFNWFGTILFSDTNHTYKHKSDWRERKTNRTWKVSLEKSWEKNKETKVCIRKRFKNLLNLLNLNFMCT